MIHQDEGRSQNLHEPFITSRAYVCLVCSGLRSSPVHTCHMLGGDVVKVVDGGYHTVILDSEKHAWTMGKNNCGQLGDGTTTDRTGSKSGQF